MEIPNGWYEITNPSVRIAKGDWLVYRHKNNKWDHINSFAPSHSVGSGYGVYDGGDLRRDYRLFRIGSPAPRKLPLNPYYSTPLPLP